MKPNIDKAIGNWLLDIEDGTLCLPRFQREQVWNKQKNCKFLETLILHSKTPVGVFLVLPTDPSTPKFPPRGIDGRAAQSGVCNSLLLDGQQRLSALWQALCDTDEEFEYYIHFNDQFKVKGIRTVGKNAKYYPALNQNPTKQCNKLYFPAKLLNPLVDETTVNDWLAQIELKKLKLKIGSTAPIKKLIIDTRKIFAKRQRSGKIIPHFQLAGNTDRDTAVSIYKTINTNSVKLSDHYLAVADMEKKTGESLYDMANRLIGRIPSIENLEADEIGELILKISCLLQGKIPSGGSYRTWDFDFHAVLNSEQRIFDGVEWAVEKLAGLNIWYGSQLPSVVPLRVLPALHQYIPKSGQQLADADQIITKYLWHTFLTGRYKSQANDILKEDYEDLKDFFKKGQNKNQIKIFNNPELPSLDDIQEAPWPNSGRLARGILLVCCQGGARTLSSNQTLTINNYKNREKHHIFPKSKLAQKVGHSGNCALNCLLVPKGDNKDYRDDLPGDYIEKLFQKLGVPLPQLSVIDRLETHLISRGMANNLVATTQNAIDNGQVTLKNAYNDFIEARAGDVEAEIKRLLR